MQVFMSKKRIFYWEQDGRKTRFESIWWIFKTISRFLDYSFCYLQDQPIHVILGKNLFHYSRFLFTYYFSKKSNRKCFYYCPLVIKRSHLSFPTSFLPTNSFHYYPTIKDKLQYFSLSSPSVNRVLGIRKVLESTLVCQHYIHRRGGHRRHYRRELRVDLLCALTILHCRAEGRNRFLTIQLIPVDVFKPGVGFDLFKSIVTETFGWITL